MIPKVSVCIPTYNRALCLDHAIRGMLAQTYQDFELIIGDDASVDGTQDLVASHRDPRIKYFQHATNLGIYRNWNFLVQQARGEYVAIYHDHDFYFPTILEQSVQVLEPQPKVVFVHTAMVLVDKNRNPTKLFSESLDAVMPGSAVQEYFFASLTHSICAATAMVRRAAYEQAGPYNPAYGLGSDKEMWLRLSRLGDIAYIKEPQAFILGRSPGDPTDRFAMEDFMGQIRMFEEASRWYYAGQEPRRLKFVDNLHKQLGRALLHAVVKALLFEENSECMDRVQKVWPQLDARSKAILKLLFINTNLSRKLLAVTALRAYQEKKRKEAEHAFRYCQAHHLLEQH